MKTLFPPLKSEVRTTLNRLPGIIDKTFPLPARFRSGLPRDVAELSRLLTSERGEREASYLGKPALLSAYLRYFLPWNIFRLSRLLSFLPLELKSHDAINDLGAGPLTLAASLWISRPSLRKIPLEFRCMDRSPAVLEAGKKLFASLSSTSGESAECPWIIKTIRGEIKRNGTLSTEIRGKPAALSASVNLYNELFWDFSPVETDKLGRFVEDQARLLLSLTDSSGQVLVMEPGIPRSGEFISLLRSSLVKKGRPPVSPCTHHAVCPLPGGRSGGGGKEKWCHFSFDTEDAPDELHKLSALAKIPKERAVLSFLLCAPAPLEGKDALNVISTKAVSGQPSKIRVISDHFPVEADPAKKTREKNSWGRYGCAESGLVLVSGSRESLENSPSGTLEELPLSPRIDAKSGAVVAEKG